MEWGFILGLVAITVPVIGLVIYLGRKLSRGVEKQASDSDRALNITPTGTILFACIVGFWIICVAARKLAPDGTLGAFLNTSDGVALVLIGSVLFGGVAGAILEKIGYPIARRKERRA